jgi:hypothetical protein
MIRFGDWKEVFLTELRFLSLLPARPDMARLGNHYLTLGLLATWLAGVGRYWDHPKALSWQYAGLGSVIYVFVLALILWLLLWPLRPSNWSYRGVLTFVAMTSPPAILYAIPVERFTSMATAQSLNALFLAVVAMWRVVLLVLYLRRSAKLSTGIILVAAPLPLALIVSALALLNLEHVVFNLMAGIRPEEQSANDGAYQSLVTLTLLSYVSSPVLVIAYIAAIISRSGNKGSESEGNGET